jgi:uncharacterized protein (UPF0261 family)/ABC-type branched-subunit amino acid transport system ATPase component
MDDMRPPGNARDAAFSTATPALDIRNLSTRYGRVPILHDLSLTLDRGVLAIVGRNGMGKTTLCKAIMGLVRAETGAVSSFGTPVLGATPHEVAAAGLAYVPQGRRVWKSLTVDEHLKLMRTSRDAAWTLDRVYDTFPRLHERRNNLGSELSGGEQQMLAISRALLQNPRLLIMDEPTEGLAPVIVQQVEEMLVRLANEGQVSVLLIEQNLGVAVDISPDIAIMVHGRIARRIPARQLAADHDLQRRLLGVGRDADADESAAGSTEADDAAEATFIRVQRQHGEGFSQDVAYAGKGPFAYSSSGAPTRWPSAAVSRPVSFSNTARDEKDAPGTADVAAVPVATLTGRNAYVAGTFDTKGPELTFLANNLRRLGLKVVTVDLATSGRPSPADISPREVARHHTGGEAAVFTADRGASVTGMAQAFERFIVTRADLGGIISAGGSGGTALATPAMRALPIGVPKFMVSTVASGDVSRYVGPSDIVMMYSVTDVQGINTISEQVLSNAAHALAGMIAHKRQPHQRAADKRAIGLTMFGLTTPCVQMAEAALRSDYDCLVFHATGTGGQSMEKLIDSGLLAGVLDVTTTEVPDLLMGGVFPATQDRFGAVIRRRLPYVGSVGAVDMVNFGPRETVPSRYQGRNLYIHNPQVTLMRTTPEENERIARFIVDRLNRMSGPVRFLLPEGGVSGIDAPGKPFHDPAANRALFSTLERLFVPSRNRKLIKLPYHINDRAFADALVRHFKEIVDEKPEAAARDAGTKGGAAWRI